MAAGTSPAGAGGLKQSLTRPIQLADQVVKLTGEAYHYKQECAELKSKAERLGTLLRAAARASGGDFYDRPALRILADTELALDKALAVSVKCRSSSVLSRAFTILPATAVKKSLSSLDNSLADFSWLLRVTTSASGSSSVDGDGGEGDDDEGQYLGLPPIAQNEPILFLIWEQIAKLHTDSPSARTEAASSLVSLARDSDRFSKLIIQEEGAPPLLRLLKEPPLDSNEAQKSAAHALGLLARDAESVELMVLAGACEVFAKILKDGQMKVQTVVAWATAEFASAYPKCQDVFAQNHVIRFLVGHLAFETIPDHSKYVITSRSSGTAASPHVVASNNTISSDLGNALDLPPKLPNEKFSMHMVVQSTIAATKIKGFSVEAKERELEDPETKSKMKAMAAIALWKLAKGNAAICRSITESRAMICFAVLLEKADDEDVRYNSAMALMEICQVAEVDADLRRSAFKPTSPATRAVVDQLVKIVCKADYDELLIPCIISLGCLARTFRSSESRIIAPLVRLLDQRETLVMKEAAAALAKFACTDNYLHIDHSKAIIDAEGAKHLIQLVYFDEEVRLPALILLCYIALHVPDSEALAEAEVHQALVWATKQAHLMQDLVVEKVLPEAISKLELYQSRGSAI